MATRQYIGARYVAKIYENTLDPESAEWQSNVNYEALIIVTYNNGSYMSKKTIPASVGNPPANPKYWTQTGFYNGQIAQLQAELARINDSLEFFPDRYDATDTYSVNDSCIYQGKEYVAIANTVGHSPTDTTYWVKVGSLDDRFDDMNTAIDAKAAKALFTPTNIPITMADLSAYTTSSCTIKCTQVGRMLILDFTLNVLGIAGGIPGGTTLNVTPIPASISANMGFNLTQGGNSSLAEARRLLITSAGIIRTIETLPAGTTFEGQLILPSTGWI